MVSLLVYLRAKRRSGSSSRGSDVPVRGTSPTISTVPRSSAPRSSAKPSPVSTRIATRGSRPRSVQRWLPTIEVSHSAVPSHTYHSAVRCGPSGLAVATRQVRSLVRKASSSALSIAILRPRRCSFAIGHSLFEYRDEIADPERGVGVKHLASGRRPVAERAGEDLPRGTAGRHQVTGESGVEPGERRYVAVVECLLHRQVERLGALVEVAGRGRAAPCGAVAHDEQGRPVRRAGERGAEPEARRSRLRLADRLQDPPAGVPGLVEQHRAKAER